MKKIILLALVIFSLSGYAQRNASISIERYYTIKKGDIWFHATRLMYGFRDGIMYPQTETDTIYFYNNMDKALEYSFPDLPEFISVQVIPHQIPSKSEGKIAVAYDTKVKDTFGPTFDYFFMETNDDQIPRKRLIVSPDIHEDFSKLTPAERANAPVIHFPNPDFDFGTLTMGEKVNHTFTYTNKGQRDLIIRATKASCGCTSPEPEKKVIAPGEEGKIKVMFNSFGKKGEQNHKVTVISNDPKNPEITLEISGKVERQ